VKLLSLYQYGAWGGVESQLVNRSRAWRTVPDLEAHFVFLEDHGIGAAFGDYPHVRFIPEEAGLAEYIAAEGFDAISVIDTPKAYPALRQAEFGGAIINEAHTTYYFLEYLRALRDDPPMHAVVTVSEYLRQRLLTEFQFEGVRPVHVVPSGLDLDLFRYREPDRQAPGPVFLWVGRVDDHKNWQDYLITAALIGAEMPEAEFWLIGGQTASDEAVAEMIEGAAAYGPGGRLRWIQEVDYHLMPRYYSLAAASGGSLLITSSNESFGMIAAEALACRCPVIATRVGALPELLVGPLAQGLYEFGAVDEAAGLALRFARDAALRRSLQDFGDEHVRAHHDVKQAALGYLAVIEAIAAEHRRQVAQPCPSLAMAEPAPDEAARAETFWAEYPLKAFYFTGKESVRRSRWLGGEVLGPYEFTSVLEPGCNCGRNLYYVLERHPGIEAAGFDVNAEAIAFARKHVPGASFEVRSVHDMDGIPDDRYDIIFTMSLLDHVPEVEAVCRNFLRIARKAVVLVEVDTGAEGKCIEHLKQEGVDNYCYSRHYARLFECLGAKVLRYQPVPEQFPETFMGRYYWLLEAAPPY